MFDLHRLQAKTIAHEGRLFFGKFEHLSLLIRPPVVLSLSAQNLSPSWKEIDWENFNLAIKTSEEFVNIL